MEEQLLSAFNLQQDISTTRCMVLIHVQNGHYMCMSLDHCYLPDPTKLKEYLIGVLEPDSESEHPTESSEAEQPEGVECETYKSEPELTS